MVYTPATDGFQDDTDHGIDTAPISGGFAGFIVACAVFLVYIKLYNRKADSKMKRTACNIKHGQFSKTASKVLAKASSTVLAFLEKQRLKVKKTYMQDIKRYEVGDNGFRSTARTKKYNRDVITDGTIRRRQNGSPNRIRRHRSVSSTRQSLSKHHTGTPRKHRKPVVSDIGYFNQSKTKRKIIDDTDSEVKHAYGSRSPERTKREGNIVESSCHEYRHKGQREEKLYTPVRSATKDMTTQTYPSPKCHTTMSTDSKSVYTRHVQSSARSYDKETSDAQANVSDASNSAMIRKKKNKGPTLQAVNKSLSVRQTSPDMLARNQKITQRITLSPVSADPSTPRQYFAGSQVKGSYDISPIVADRVDCSSQVVRSRATRIIPLSTKCMQNKKLGKSGNALPAPPRPSTEDTVLWAGNSNNRSVHSDHRVVLMARSITKNEHQNVKSFVLRKHSPCNQNCILESKTGKHKLCRILRKNDGFHCILKSSTPKSTQYKTATEPYTVDLEACSDELVSLIQTTTGDGLRHIGVSQINPGLPKAANGVSQINPGLPTAGNVYAVKKEKNTLASTKNASNVVHDAKTAQSTKNVRDAELTNHARISKERQYVAESNEKNKEKNFLHRHSLCISKKKPVNHSNKTLLQSANRDLMHLLSTFCPENLNDCKSISKCNNTPNSECVVMKIKNKKAKPTTNQNFRKESGEQEHRKKNNDLQNLMTSHFTHRSDEAYDGKLSKGKDALNGATKNDFILKHRTDLKGVLDQRDCDVVDMVSGNESSGRNIFSRKETRKRLYDQTSLPCRTGFFYKRRKEADITEKQHNQNGLLVEREKAIVATMFRNYQGKQPSSTSNKKRINSDCDVPQNNANEYSETPGGKTTLVTSMKPAVRSVFNKELTFILNNAQLHSNTTNITSRMNPVSLIRPQKRKMSLFTKQNRKSRFKEKLCKDCCQSMFYTNHDTWLSPKSYHHRYRCGVITRRGDMSMRFPGLATCSDNLDQNCVPVYPGTGWNFGASANISMNSPLDPSDSDEHEVSFSKSVWSTSYTQVSFSNASNKSQMHVQVIGERPRCLGRVLKSRDKLFVVNIPSEHTTASSLSKSIPATQTSRTYNLKRGNSHKRECCSPKFREGVAIAREYRQRKSHKQKDVKPVPIRSNVIQKVSSSSVTLSSSHRKLLEYKRGRNIEKGGKSQKGPNFWSIDPADISPHQIRGNRYSQDKSYIVDSFISLANSDYSSIYQYEAKSSASKSNLSSSPDSRWSMWPFPSSSEVQAMQNCKQNSKHNRTKGYPFRFSPLGSPIRCSHVEEMNGDHETTGRHSCPMWTRHDSCHSIHLESEQVSYMKIVPKKNGASGLRLTRINLPKRIYKGQRNGALNVDSSDLETSSALPSSMPNCTMRSSDDTVLPASSSLSTSDSCLSLRELSSSLVSVPKYLHKEKRGVYKGRKKGFPSPSKYRTLSTNVNTEASRLYECLEPKKHSTKSSESDKEIVGMNDHVIRRAKLKNTTSSLSCCKKDRVEETSTKMAIESLADKQKDIVKNYFSTAGEKQTRTAVDQQVSCHLEDFVLPILRKSKRRKPSHSDLNKTQIKRSTKTIELVSGHEKEGITKTTEKEPTKIKYMEQIIPNNVDSVQLVQTNEMPTKSSKNCVKFSSMTKSKSCGDQLNKEMPVPKCGKGKSRRSSSKLKMKTNHEVNTRDHSLLGQTSHLEAPISKDSGSNLTYIVRKMSDAKNTKSSSIYQNLISELQDISRACGIGENTVTIEAPSPQALTEDQHPNKISNRKHNPDEFSPTNVRESKNDIVQKQAKDISPTHAVVQQRQEKKVQSPRIKMKRFVSKIPIPITGTRKFGKAQNMLQGARVSDDIPTPQINATKLPDDKLVQATAQLDKNKSHENTNPFSPSHSGNGVVPAGMSLPILQAINAMKGADLGLELCPIVGIPLHALGLCDKQQALSSAPSTRLLPVSQDKSDTHNSIALTTTRTSTAKPRIFFYIENGDVENSEPVHKSGSEKEIDKTLYQSSIPKKSKTTHVKNSQKCSDKGNIYDTSSKLKSFARKSEFKILRQHNLLQHKKPEKKHLCKRTKETGRADSLSKTSTSPQGGNKKKFDFINKTSCLRTPFQSVFYRNKVAANCNKQESFDFSKGVIAPPPKQPQCETTSPKSVSPYPAEAEKNMKLLISALKGPEKLSYYNRLQRSRRQLSGPPILRTSARSFLRNKYGLKEMINLGRQRQIAKNDGDLNRSRLDSTLPMKEKPTRKIYGKSALTKKKPTKAKSRTKTVEKRIRFTDPQLIPSPTYSKCDCLSREVWPNSHADRSSSPVSRLKKMGTKSNLDTFSSMKTPTALEDITLTLKTPSLTGMSLMTIDTMDDVSESLLDSQNCPYTQNTPNPPKSKGLKY